MTRVRLTPPRSLGFVTAVVVLPLLAARGQSGPDNVETRRWRMSSTIEVTTAYDNNIYLLTDSKLDNVASPSASSITSGRYADMESAGDVVTTLRAAAELKGAGIRGRTLRLVPEAEYDAYMRNARRRNASLSFTVGQSLRHDGELRLRTRLTPNYFAKNYLADAFDQDGDGSIAARERVYAAGIYAERELSLDYRLRIAKSTKAHPFGGAVRVGAGYYGRSYDAPFAARDLSGPTFEVALPLDLTRRLGVEMRYERLQLAATPTRSVLLLDESQFQQDFNGNGTTADRSARAFEMIDRSRAENSLDLEARYELTRRTELRLGYEHRSRSYGSAEPYDVANNGRRDSRNEFAIELAWRVMHGLEVVAAGRASAQTLNRENDPGAVGDVDDYSKQQFRLRLARRF